ncbi:hypothetical protein LCGC14_0951870 [marine sediment metagenome]|uniref:Uncharacterized protein n=1 Tax=marine sediment metagenome TaxID=412755 RepID=A0A0F9RNG4_9ZZZZ
MNNNPSITKSLGEAYFTIVHDSNKGIMPPNNRNIERGEKYDRKTKPKKDRAYCIT